MNALDRGASAATAPRGINDAEFALFQSLVRQKTGIRLTDAKRALLVSRLARRLRELGLRTFHDYYRLVTAVQGESECVRMFDLIATNETHFFREPKQFELLENRIIPQWRSEAAAQRRSRRLSVWSAGCSTGEEPFSIAMLLASRLSAEEGWHLDIVATDLSTRVLRAAADATWPVAKAAEIPQAFLRRFMLRGTGSEGGRMKAHASLRALIRFERRNLNDGGLPPGGPFDLVFCRNVLIYFEAEARQRVVSRLIDGCARGGYLFLGHAEILNGLDSRLSSLRSNAWVKR